MPKREKKEEVLPTEKKTEEPKSKKTKKDGAKPEKEADGPILYQDSPDKFTSSNGKKYTLKITSWNVDGIRAWFKKKGLELINMPVASARGFEFHYTCPVVKKDALFA